MRNPTAPLPFAFPAMLIVAVLLGVSSSRADKGDFWLDVNVTSKHSESTYVFRNRERKFNEGNFGLGATYEISKYWEAKVGWFENSYSETSIYALVGLRKRVVEFDHWSLTIGVVAGAVSGYEDTPEQTDAVTPWGMPVLTVEYQNRWRANIGYAPISLFREGSIDFAVLQISLKL